MTKAEYIKCLLKAVEAKASALTVREIREIMGRNGISIKKGEVVW